MFLRSSRGVRTRIKAKFQAFFRSDGAKPAYALLNAIEAHPERYAFIMIGGDGWSTGVRPWLRAAARRYARFSVPGGKRVEVVTVAELEARLNSIFSTPVGIIPARAE